MTTHEALEALTKLTVKMNKVTARWRHQKSTRKDEMDDLCNAQLDAEAALASPARTEGFVPIYPVELRCAELEELLRDLGKALKALPATDGRVIGLIPYLNRIDAALHALEGEKRE